MNLTVPKGEFFGLLGPNGAGKTTLIQAIVGLCRLTVGEIYVFDHHVVKDYTKSKQLIGYSPQEVNLERFFTIKRTLQFQAGFFGATNKEQKQIANRLLNQFGLKDKKDNQFYKLSGGMQKRALIAKALVSQPKLLILDEPTAGIDVEQRHELWKYLQQLNADGTTIILTTHYIDEAEALCDRIGIINLGEIKELGSPSELIHKYCKPTICICTNKPIAPQALHDITTFSVEIEGKKITAQGARSGIMTQEILKAILTQPDLKVENISVNNGTLEEVFLQVTGRTISEMERSEKDLEKKIVKKEMGKDDWARERLGD